MFRRSESKATIPAEISLTEDEKNLLLIQGAIKTIRVGLIAAAPFMPNKFSQPKESLTGYNKWMQRRDTSKPGLAVLQDGFVLSAVKEGFLVLVSHRLKIPVLEDQPVEYGRIAIHQDYQAAGSININLTGEEEISKDLAAAEQIQWLEQQIDETSRIVWSNDPQNIYPTAFVLTSLF